MRAAPLALVVILAAVPAAAIAATIVGGRTLVVSEPSQGNSYLYGGDITVTTPVAGDLLAAGGTVTASAAIGGDVLIAGGSVEVRKPVAGDLRAIGGTIRIDDAVGGDLLAFGASVIASTTPSYAWIGGGTVSLSGSKGPVTIYGGTISLSGTYAGDIHLIASDHISIAPNTKVHGHLQYDAPQQIELPEGAVVDGGVQYTGKSYLPTSQEAQTFAIAGASIFFLVRVLAVVIAAGLLTGLFPTFAQAVADRALSRPANRFFMQILLGFGVIVATPVLILLLLASFAGAAIAFVLFAAYLLLLILSMLFSGVIAGAALARRFTKRSLVLWRDAVFGMLALSVIALVPILGAVVDLILMAAACGILVSLTFRFAYPKEEEISLE